MRTGLIILPFCFFLLSCGKDKTTTPAPTPNPVPATEIVALRSEYEAVGDVIYDINDLKEGSISYSIISGNENNHYTINSSSGIISIAVTIPDATPGVTKHTLKISAGRNNYTIVVADGLDYTVQNLSGTYSVLDEDNEAFVDPSSQWTAINNLWGKGTAVPNVNFRIVTLHKTNLPDSIIFLWDVPGNASMYGGDAVWCYVNSFWGNRKNIRENLTGFPFRIGSLSNLKLDFDFQKLYGNEEYKIALNAFLTDESELSPFSANDGDFFFVFDQRGNYVPPYPVSLPDTMIEGKNFVRRYKTDATGYEWRRVIIKDGERYLSGSLDFKKVLGGFMDKGYIKSQQYIYHLQLGLEITKGFGGMRFNKAKITMN